MDTNKLFLNLETDLSILKELGYKYYKSFKHFRKATETGYSYITLNVTTHNRIYYSIAFYCATRIDEVEIKLQELKSKIAKLDHNKNTMWVYTVNIGPSSPHWNYPVHGSWSIKEEAEYKKYKPEIVEFVKEICIPFVTENTDPLTVRNNLLSNPGKSTNIYPYEQILTIDLLYKPDSIEEDIKILSKRYENFSPEPLKRYHNFIKLIKDAK